MLAKESPRRWSVFSYDIANFLIVARRFDSESKWALVDDNRTHILTQSERMINEGDLLWARNGKMTVGNLWPRQVTFQQSPLYAFTACLELSGHLSVRYIYQLLTQIPSVWTTTIKLFHPEKPDRTRGRTSYFWKNELSLSPCWCVSGGLKHAIYELWTTTCKSGPIGQGSQLLGSIIQNHPAKYIPSYIKFPGALNPTTFLKSFLLPAFIASQDNMFSELN